MNGRVVKRCLWFFETALLTFALISIREEHPHDVDILICVVCSGLLMSASAAMLIMALVDEVRASHQCKPERWPGSGQPPPGHWYD
jgi:hypothetical protein